MKRKMINFLIIAAVSVSLTTCEKKEDQAQQKRLMTLVDSTMSYAIYVHDETGVMYFSYCNGGTCVMVDVDGNPLIWDKRK